jgi:hypothetical protein
MEESRFFGLIIVLDNLLEVLAGERRAEQE